MSDYTEYELVEKPAVELFRSLGYYAYNSFHEKVGDESSTLGRKTSSDVVLISILRSAISQLNPELTPDEVNLAIDELTRDRSAQSLVNANHEIHNMIRDGVKIPIQKQNGEEELKTVRVIDFNDPDNNDFFLTSQFRISGDVYKRRADIVGFVNGLPLIFIELKTAHKRLENAYNNNLADYKKNIPQIFWYNAFIILSNGVQSKIGTITSTYEYFSEWKKISSEGEEGIVSLDTIIRGTCAKDRFLDLLENFIIFTDEDGPLTKMIARNHQFLGVNNAIASVEKVGNNGKIGVFWHTQGSGKSYSMIFFSRKILRKFRGNYTFVIVTDRIDLDDQIYGKFHCAGAITEPHVRAEDCEQLRQLLREDHRYVFTLIQKFRTGTPIFSVGLEFEDGLNNLDINDALREMFSRHNISLHNVYVSAGSADWIIHGKESYTIRKEWGKLNVYGSTYPKLSDRSDIIVITDEAHRSQYDVLAMNMRTALPNAAFIAFTGTPLIIGEEKTRDTFGDYVSIYNFKQSIDDGGTVPLFYENRTPELELTNEELNKDMMKVIEENELDEEREYALEREFTREYHIITRDDRLEKVAEDIVSHFMGRGYMGKAMVMSIDKLTTVKMYDKVKKHWGIYLEGLLKHLEDCDDEEREELQKKIDYMRTTDMAVVISSEQNEVEKFREKGLDILPHRQRMNRERLADKFRDSDDPFRIVFVCRMWMEGFDVHSLSTIYLDKPMRNHSLMQAIARANRVCDDKQNGLIVDYIGIFRNLKDALAIYGSSSGGGVGVGDTPVSPKTEIIRILREAVDELMDFCMSMDIDLQKIINSKGLEKLGLLDGAMDAILTNDESKRSFHSHARKAIGLYQALLPHPDANEFTPIRVLMGILLDMLNEVEPHNITDISEVRQSVEVILDKSVKTAGYVIDEVEGRSIDLSKLDFEALRKKFIAGRKHIETENMKRLISGKLGRMVIRNRSRTDYLEKFQLMIDDYNDGRTGIDLLFDNLVIFAKELNEEEKRCISENLSEEELAIFDLLYNPDLTDQEKDQVKNAARRLLRVLKYEKFVLDWRKRQQTRAQVINTIRDVLDQELPQSYTKQVYDQKCEEIYQHVYDSYYDSGQSVYN